jgi:hypothetical protein
VPFSDYARLLLEDDVAFSLLDLILYPDPEDEDFNTKPKDLFNGLDNKKVLIRNRISTLDINSEIVGQEVVLNPPLFKSDPGVNKESDSIELLQPCNSQGQFAAQC